MKTAEILRFPLHSSGDCASTARTIVEWASNRESRVVQAANVHMVMMAWDDAELHALMRTADLSVQDGRPLVWALRMLGEAAEHVRGTDLTQEVCRQAQESGLSVGLYGSTPETLAAFRQFLGRTYPSLPIPFAVSPPFRELTELEDEAMVDSIRGSGARILLVGLGCPKQERWMLVHRDRVPCVMLGVGAAFAFLSGATREAPRWMQRAGLEWLFRLASDPRRLWRRYLKYNPRFVLLFGTHYAWHLAAKLRTGGKAQQG